MRATRGRVSNTTFHVEGLHPASAALAGALGFLAAAVAILLIVLAISGDALEAAWAYPVLVTAAGAGGAAGVALKNLNLKRAESRRGANLMFDQQFETGARLLGGDGESEIVAGSLLIGSLLRESPRHAQACADLLCAALRVRKQFDLTPDEEAELMPDPPAEYVSGAALALRVANAITDAIERATCSSGAPAHLGGVRWDLTEVVLGDRAFLRNCLFGAGSMLRWVHARGGLDLSGSVFASSVDLLELDLWSGLSLRGIEVDGSLGVIDCRLRGLLDDGLAGVVLEGASTQGLRISGVRAKGPLHLDAAKVDGDVWIDKSSATYFSMIDGSCSRFVLLEGLTLEDYICIRRTPVRKGVLVKGCDSGAEIEVTGVDTLGSVDVVNCTYGDLILGDSDPNAFGAQRG